MLRVLLVEDDTDQVEDITLALDKAFGNVVVEIITTESAFRESIDRSLEKCPDVIVIDVMVQGSAEDEPELPVTEPVFHKAGFRCETLLRSRGNRTPVILYSVLDRSRLEESLAGVSPQTTYVMKEFELDSLTDAITKMIAKD
jgi:CheY-like chemotaxis protein